MLKINLISDQILRQYRNLTTFNNRHRGLEPRDKLALIMTAAIIINGILVIEKAYAK